MSRVFVALATLFALVGNIALRPALAQTPAAGLAGPPLIPAATVLTPPTAGAPAPPRAVLVHQRRTGLTVGGGIIFGLSWGGAVFLSVAMLASGCCHPSNAISFSIPVLGPVAAGPMADSDVMILWSLAQLGGAVMLYYGLKGEDVPAGSEAPPARSVRTGPTLGLAPMLGRDAGGLTLTARW